jgi:hypothetical protein
MKQFSIRDLLFLVVIVALALGWWLDKRPVPARFQLQCSGNTFCKLDTATGEVWFQSDSGFSDPLPAGK